MTRTFPPKGWADDPEMLLGARDIAAILETNVRSAHSMLDRGSIPSEIGMMDYHHKPMRVVRSKDMQEYLRKRFFTEKVKLPSRDTKSLNKFLRKRERDAKRR